MALEKLIAMQNKEFFELRGKLKLNTNKVDRIAILKANNQFIPESNSEVKLYRLRYMIVISVN